MFNFPRPDCRDAAAVKRVVGLHEAATEHQRSGLGEGAKHDSYDGETFTPMRHVQAGQQRVDLPSTVQVKRVHLRALQATTSKACGCSRVSSLSDKRLSRISRL
jgi:hypothetical protein